jgi:hypothetical protein
MSRGVATFQIVSTIGGVAAAFFMYRNYIAKHPDKQNSQGLDPNWNGQPINPTAPIAVPQTGCQVWNSQQNLFEHAGATALDVSSDQCFSGTGTNQLVRYTDPQTGTTTWKAGDPITEDPALHGTCLFYDGTQLYHFPEIGGQMLPPNGIYPKGGFESGVPPNRSQRLCFNSGDSVETAGRFFVADDGTMTLNPLAAYNPFFIEAAPQEWGNFTILNQGNSSFSMGPPIKQNHCEVFRQLTNQNNVSPPANALTPWAYGNDGGPGLNADQKTCLALPNSRYWDYVNQKIVYIATDGTQIQTEMLKE